MNYTPTPTSIRIHKVTPNGYVWADDEPIRRLELDDYTDPVVRTAILKAGLPSGQYVAEYDTPQGRIFHTFTLETVSISNFV